MNAQTSVHFGSGACIPPIFRMASLVVVIGLIVMGSGFMLGSGFVLWRTNAWVASSSTATGTVIAQATSATSTGQPIPTGARRTTAARTGRPTRAEVVEFTTPDGARHEFRSKISSSDPFAVDAAVPVRYNPVDPTDATIDTWFRVWGFPFIFFAAGLVEVVVGIGFLAVTRRVSA